MSPQSDAPTETRAVTAEYSADERELLLRLAHHAISSALEGLKLDLTPPTPHLAELRGAFTTLHLHGKLCGCIGYVIPTHSLYRTVAETAQAAAFDDPRFDPVTPDEAPHLSVEISVLSRLQPIRPEEVVVGVHGLVVSHGIRRGLLLPQVPVEWQWNRETFLAQTCLKARLPPDAWRQGADLQAFTAEVFGDESRLTFAP
ncbi:MAG TPA: AmmeMemoRadiSam system protein A [Candidatus Eisenbacteria bacterium]|nr:AmmeMemoRadiSam system protein A [Candidatus Eisenbacteria bacterium]